MEDLAAGAGEIGLKQGWNKVEWSIRLMQDRAESELELRLKKDRAKKKLEYTPEAG